MCITEIIKPITIQVRHKHDIRTPRSAVAVYEGVGKHEGALYCSKEAQWFACDENGEPVCPIGNDAKIELVD